MPGLSSTAPRNGSTLCVLKVFGRKGRLGRTLRALQQMKADDSGIACLCQDDKTRDELAALGFHCFSFHEELDQETEAEAWRWAWEIRRRSLALLSRESLAVRGYDCTECLIWGDADQFAFISSLVLLREKLARKDFKTVVLVPNEKYLSSLPDSSSGRYFVITDMDSTEVLRHVRSMLAPYVFPVLAMLRGIISRHEYNLYNMPGRHLSGTAKPRVLMVVTDGIEFPSYYSRPAAAIAQGCVELGHDVFIVTNRFSSSEVFLKAGFSKKRYRKPFQTGFLGIWRQLLRLRDRMLEFQGDGSVVAEAERLGLNLLREKSASRALRAADDVIFIDGIFEQSEPDVLVSMPENSQFGMSAITVARQKSIPSLTALAGQIFDHPQYGHLISDMVAVNGEQAKSVFENRGVPPERVVVTGMAHFDETFHLAKAPYQTKPSESKLIVFATENLPLSETLEMIGSVAEFVLATPDTRMLIRPHPRENPADYPKYLREFGSDRISLDTETPLLDLLRMAEVCVTGYSNVAVEAMIMGRPVVCMNLRGKPSKMGYVESGAAIGVQNPKEAALALSNALYDQGTRAALAKGRDAFLNSNFYRGDGKASLRIASLIEKLATKRNHGLG